MKKLISILFWLAVCAPAVFAQSSITVQAPNLVAADEQFNITFVISGEDAPSDFQWTPGNDFQLVWGPQRGTSTSVSWVNGKHTKSSQTTYTYVLLPRKTGTFTLPAATAKIKGQTITSKSCSLEVVANGSASSQGGSGSSQQSSPSASSQSQTPKSGSVSSDDIFLRMTLSKSSVVVGESLTATLKLYQRVNIAGFEDVHFPSFTGFWSQELQAPSNIDFHRESIGDNIYNAAILRSWTLVPQQSGDLKIDPAELVCLVNVRVPQASSGSIFDSFFQDEYQTIRKRVSSSAVTVKARQLPSGAPASFGGGVGSFTMTAALAKDSLSTHDASSLTVTVSGKGNVSLLEAPKINFPPDFEQYDVKVTENAGSKTFEYPFIPRSHGDFVIGPVEYSYYDVKTGRYVTLKSKEMKLKVKKGSGDSVSSNQGQLVSSTVRTDVKDLGSDIRYITVENSGLNAKGSSFAASTLFWIFTAVLAAFAALAYFAIRKTEARRSDVVGRKGRAASKMARKRLSKAGEYLQSNLYTAFYEELHKALLGYVSDKLNMEESDMSKDNIMDSLRKAGVPEKPAADFVALLDACEFARYSPDSGHEAMNAHYESAVDVISQMEQSMKKKTSRGGAAVVALIMLMALPMNAGAQNADSLWVKGTQAYEASRWSDAAASWKAIEAMGLESSDLYCNIGDALFKEGDIAHSILYYERALKVDPSNRDAKYNLAFANTKIQDKIETVPEFFLKSWSRTLCRSLSADTWAVLFLCLFAVFLAMVVLFLVARGRTARKAGFITGIVVLVIALFTLSMSLWQRADNSREDSAIVVVPFSSVKSSPSSEGSTDLFVLHEGVKVKILDKVGGWSNIELSDGRQGWIEEGNVEII